MTESSNEAAYEFTRVVPSRWVPDKLEIYDVIGGVEIVTGNDVEVRYS